MVRPLHAVILLLLSGCATSETAAPVVAGPPPAGMASVTLTRVGAYGFAAAVAIDMNGSRIADLAVNGSHQVAVAPGPVSFTASMWSAPGSYTLRFTAEPNKSYRLAVSPRGESIAAGIAGGIIGMAAEGNGPFKITVQ